MGSLVLAIYWWWDGLSFATTFALGSLAYRRIRSGASHVAYCRAACFAAIVTIVVDVGFLTTALIRWNDVMNPLSQYVTYTSYGTNGSSFFFCSLYSALCNVWIFIHFLKMGRRSSLPASTKSMPEAAP